MIKSWMVIGGITFLVALVGGFLVKPRGIKWFKRLRRPRWLTFEPAIPVIWTVVFTTGALSAIQVWEKEPGSPRTWTYMAVYLLLELVTVAYNPTMLLFQSLKMGTIVGGLGFVIALLLAIAVLPVSATAAALLIPYLLWSPIGTYTTWKMIRLNPADA